MRGINAMKITHDFPNEINDFSVVVAQYQKPVYNFCYRMLGDAQSAEDAAQETFFRAYKNINRFDRKRNFATWLLSIAAHYCIDQQRKKWMPSFDFNEMGEFMAEDPAPKPESAVILREQTDQVQRVLAALNETDRAVLVLKYWYQVSDREIGNSLGISVSAVKSRLHRARKHMANQWLVKNDHLSLDRKGIIFHAV